MEKGRAIRIWTSQLKMRNWVPNYVSNVSIQQTLRASC